MKQDAVERTASSVFLQSPGSFSTMYLLTSNQLPGSLSAFEVIILGSILLNNPTSKVLNVCIAFRFSGRHDTTAILRNHCPVRLRRLPRSFARSLFHL